MFFCTIYYLLSIVLIVWFSFSFSILEAVHLTPLNVANVASTWTKLVFTLNNKIQVRISEISPGKNSNRKSLDQYQRRNFSTDSNNERSIQSLSTLPSLATLSSSAETTTTTTTVPTKSSSNSLPLLLSKGFAFYKSYGSFDLDKSVGAIRSSLLRPNDRVFQGMINIEKSFLMCCIIMYIRYLFSVFSKLKTFVEQLSMNNLCIL